MTKILLIDDDEILSKALTAVLEDDGYQVLVAKNGQDGFAQLADWRPDLILCDIMMPVMDGWTFLTQLKADPAYGTLPIMMLSAYDEDKDRVRSIEMGADALVSKHLTFQMIRIQVKKLLHQAR